MATFILALKGFCIGIANIIPGVSGGTMAFILGIYEDLILAIKSFDLKFLRLLLSLKIKEAFRYASWKFLGAVVFGALLAVFSLSHILDWLLVHQPVLIYSFFFGLIIASAVLVGRSIRRWSPGMILGALVSTFCSFLLVGLVPVQTPETLWFVFVCGIIAICAMILPGISGSFLLLVFGKYQYILEAVNQRDFFVLSIFALGACAGLIIFTRVLYWLLARFHHLVLVILVGLMIGSLRRIWPWKETLQAYIDRHGDIIPLVQKNSWPNPGNKEFVFALIFAVFGYLLAFGLEVWSKRLNK
ncbi:MAG: DUF368 domain-containing protein [Candidatus Omnitrophota bacterium]